MTTQAAETLNHNLPFALEALSKIASLAVLGLPYVFPTGILNGNVESKILAKKKKNELLTQTLKSSLNLHQCFGHVELLK